jgi:hypothetical protein
MATGTLAYVPFRADTWRDPDFGVDAEAGVFAGGANVRRHRSLPFVAAA